MATQLPAPVPASTKTSRLVRIGSSWKFELVVFVLALLVVLARTNAIQQAFPGCCFPGINYPLNWHDWTFSKDLAVYLFWALASFWAICFGIRKKAENVKANEAKLQSEQMSKNVDTVRGAASSLQDRVRLIGESADAFDAKLELATTNISRIDEAVQTLPSPEFRTEFARKSSFIYTLVATNCPRRERDGDPSYDPALTVRSVLAQILSLRQLYEGNQKGRYAGNLMIYVPRAVAPYFSAGILDRVRELAPDAGVQGDELAGVLVLRRELSTSTDNPPAEDKQIAEIALGIPNEPKEKSPWILPGAAETFVRSSATDPSDFISGHYDTARVEDLSQSHSVPPEMLKRIKEYFNTDGRQVRSYISLPLVHPNKSPFGVLNIHSDEVYAGGNNKQRQLNFGLIVMPLVHEIAELCRLWAKKEGIEL